MYENTGTDQNPNYNSLSNIYYEAGLDGSGGAVYYPQGYAATTPINGVNVYQEWTGGTLNTAAGVFLKNNDNGDIIGPIKSDINNMSYDTGSFLTSNISNWTYYNTDAASVVKLTMGLEGPGDTVVYQPGFVESGLVDGVKFYVESINNALDETAIYFKQGRDSANNGGSDEGRLIGPILQSDGQNHTPATIVGTNYEDWYEDVPVDGQSEFADYNGVRPVISNYHNYGLEGDGGEVIIATYPNAMEHLDVKIHTKNELGSWENYVYVKIGGTGDPVGPIMDENGDIYSYYSQEQIAHYGWSNTVAFEDSKMNEWHVDEGNGLINMSIEYATDGFMTYNSGVIVYPTIHVVDTPATIDGVKIYVESTNSVIDDSAGFFIKNMNGDVVGPLTAGDGTQYTSGSIVGTLINDWHTDNGTVTVSLADTPMVGYESDVRKLIIIMVITCLPTWMGRQVEAWRLRFGNLMVK